MSNGVSVPNAGGLSRQEFIEQLTQQGVSEQAAARTADRIDARGDAADGVISRDEVRTDYQDMMQRDGAENFQTVQVNFNGSAPMPATPGDTRGPGEGGDPMRQLLGQLTVDLFGTEPNREVPADEFSEAAMAKLIQSGAEEAEARALAQELLAAAQTDAGVVTRQSMTAMLA